MSDSDLPAQSPLSRLLLDLDELQTPDNDSEYFLECELLKIEISELVKREVRSGDGSLVEKARRVLAVGAKHLKQGRPSAEFLKYLELGIVSVLTAREQSLDGAFRLKNSGRPQKDPYADPAIIKYLEHMGEFFASCDVFDPAQQGKRLVTAQRKGIDLAYEIAQGVTPQEHKKQGFSIETIKKRKDVLRDTLRDLGHYRIKGKMSYEAFSGLVTFDLK